ncbi:hypothetical protein SRABI26_03693 [Arthrobacter sp. Bi26]|nr:hypothetical protein SRABI26_03693 [Arthrobacter sp. Bi26]
MAQELCRQDDADARDFLQGGGGCGQGVAGLGLVVFDAGIDAPEIGQQFPGEIASERVGRCCRPDGAQRGGGLVGTEAGLDTAGYQFAQEPVQAVEQPGAFVAQIVAAFGQQAQNRALVFGGHGAQILLPQGRDGNSKRIGRVTLPATAGGKEPDLHGQRGGNIDHGLPTGHKDLGNSASQAVGALDSESAFRPLPGPTQQLPGGAGIDDEPPHRELTARGVDS